MKIPFYKPKTGRSNMATTRMTPITEMTPPDHRCTYTVPQHICGEECYWIAEPIDEEMTSRIVLITPEIAAAWLKRNDRNRTFSRDTSRVLAAEMTRGYWRENGESIVFDRAGVLIDGQHRLQAVLSSGRQYRCAVITGIEAEARSTVDTGKKRSGAANLQMAGEKNSTVLSAVLTLWKGYVAHDTAAMTYPAQKSPERRTSIPRIIEYLHEWPGLREACTVSLSLRDTGHGRALIPASEAAMIWFAITQSGATKERASEYLGSVLSGYNLSENSPIISLRRRLIDNLGTGRQLDKRERLALILKTWQLWSTGQTRRQIRWDSDQDFPFLS